LEQDKYLFEHFIEVHHQPPEALMG
jgi:hypothetical protein